MGDDSLDVVIKPDPTGTIAHLPGLRKSRRNNFADVVTKIRMLPEWVSGWPLWENYADVYRPTGTDLGLSRALSDALYAWNEVWLSRQEAPEPAGWGRVRRLVSFQTAPRGRSTGVS